VSSHHSDEFEEAWHSCAFFFWGNMLITYNIKCKKYLCNYFQVEVHLLDFVHGFNFCIIIIINILMNINYLFLVIGVKSSLQLSF
jgi:hypothetical protein